MFLASNPSSFSASKFSFDPFRLSQCQCQTLEQIWFSVLSIEHVSLQCITMYIGIILKNPNLWVQSVQSVHIKAYSKSKMYNDQLSQVSVSQVTVSQVSVKITAMEKFIQSSFNVKWNQMIWSVIKRVHILMLYIDFFSG